LARTAIAVAIAAAAAVMSGPAQAQAQAQGHDHGHATPSRLELDHGRKWATDEPLRAGMTRIRSLAAAQLPAAHGGKLPAEQYVALAGQIEAEVGQIVAQCKLAPQADAMLHLVIAQIGAGTDAMAGRAGAVSPSQGLAKVVLALNDYARFFDHSGFKPIGNLH
jgi:hypothetical protein